VVIEPLLCFPDSRETKNKSSMDDASTTIAKFNASLPIVSTTGYINPATAEKFMLGPILSASTFIFPLIIGRSALTPRPNIVKITANKIFIVEKNKSPLIATIIREGKSVFFKEKRITSAGKSKYANIATEYAIIDSLKDDGPR